MSVRFISALLYSILFLIVDVVVQHRETIILKTGWKFSKGEQAQASQKNVDDTAWQTVTVPHDWAIAGPVIKAGDGDTGKLPVGKLGLDLMPAIAEVPFSSEL